MLWYQVAETPGTYRVVVAVRLGRGLLRIAIAGWSGRWLRWALRVCIIIGLWTEDTVSKVSFEDSRRAHAVLTDSNRPGPEAGNAAAVDRPGDNLPDNLGPDNLTLSDTAAVAKEGWRERDFSLVPGLSGRSRTCAKFVVTEGGNGGIIGLLRWWARERLWLAGGGFGDGAEKCDKGGAYAADRRTLSQ